MEQSQEVLRVHIVRDPSQPEETYFAAFHRVEMLCPLDNLEIDLEPDFLKLLLYHFCDQLIAPAGGVELECDYRQAFPIGIPRLRQQLSRPIRIVSKPFHVLPVAWHGRRNGPFRGRTLATENMLVNGFPVDGVVHRVAKPFVGTQRGYLHVESEVV